MAKLEELSNKLKEMGVTDFHVSFDVTDQSDAECRAQAVLDALGSFERGECKEWVDPINECTQQEDE